MTYDEKLAAAAEKIGHCRVLGGLVDDDVARQVLEAIGVVPDMMKAEDDAKTKATADVDAKVKVAAPAKAGGKN